MTDRPILFSAPMVRALLDGRKIQTRRALNPQPETFPIDDAGTPCQVGCMQLAGEPMPRVWLGSDQAGVLTTQKVRFAVGDRLWVKETWSHTGTGVWQTSDVAHARDGEVIYRATDDRPGAGWFPSIFMFRRHSRLTLLVTDVRVLRLQDISEEDARAEGLGSGDCDGMDPRCWFRDLWDGLNGAPILIRDEDGNVIDRQPNPNRWDADPLVVAVTFSTMRRNIDSLGRG